ncbi:MAG: IS66 family transposase [Verrucomicrobia bacterium]|nr:IS66 family transposase [Verrucomicrobiota bacterium]
MSVSKAELSDLEREVLQGLEPSRQQKLLDAFQQSSSRVASLQEKLSLAELENRYLRELLRRERLAKYGPGSEKLSDAQLALLELEPSVQQAEVEAESLRPPLELTPRQPHNKSAAHPGRQALPAHLPRVERIVACSPEQCRCAQCGRNTELIGYEVSEQLDCEPAKPFVLVTKREKRACKACEEQGVQTALLPARIIPKGLVSDRVIIDTVINKYCNFLPLYRQSVILQRETGLELARATLCGWVMTVGELLRPVSGAMRLELLRSDYLQADETPVDVQSERTKGKNHQGYLWEYGQPGATVVFDFRMDRSAAGPEGFLAGFAGLLQTDGYAGYGRVGAPGLVHAGCWAHVRRYFYEAVQLNAQDVTAIGIVVEINKLFEIEAELKALGLAGDQRLEWRQERSAPIVDGLESRIKAAAQAALPRSALGKACKYALGRWIALSRFLIYGQLELSTNLAENAIRPIALGRKNWLHIGSERAGPKVAAILSVVESCRRLSISVREYLGEILPGLADYPARRVGELTPAAWKARRAGAAS